MRAVCEYFATVILQMNLRRKLPVNPGSAAAGSTTATSQQKSAIESELSLPPAVFCFQFRTQESSQCDSLGLTEIVISFEGNVFHRKRLR